MKSSSDKNAGISTAIISHNFLFKEHFVAEIYVSSLLGMVHIASYASAICIFFDDIQIEPRLHVSL
jgi:hypothetical protein